MSKQKEIVCPHDHTAAIGSQ